MRKLEEQEKRREKKREKKGGGRKRREGKEEQKKKKREGKDVGKERRKIENWKTEGVQEVKRGWKKRK